MDADAGRAPVDAAAGVVPTGAEPESAGDASAAIICDLVHALRGRGEEFLADPGIEPVHRLRVAIRRLRALVAYLEPVLDRSVVKAADGLRPVARELGTLRDIDVLLGHLDGGGVALPEAVHARARHELILRRSRLCVAVLNTVSASSWGRTLRLLRRGAAHTRTRGADAPACEFLGSRLTRGWERLVPRWADISELPDERRHRVRIDTKRLRYALEACEGRVEAPAGATERVLAGLEDLQDSLGALNDRRVAVALLASVGVDADLAQEGRDAEFGRARDACARLIAGGPAWGASVGPVPADGVRFSSVRP